ncbi:MAG: hypothetical protein IPJ74_25065 [Saprospiraceae bacterium]|nr:hypothetical protein [Saprospiraceae bacterium]
MESFLLNGAAFVLAFGAVISLMPALTLVYRQGNGMDYSNSRVFGWAYDSGFLIGTLIAGLYPAFVLSSFKPITAMRNRKSQRRRQLLRKGLVVAQFVASIVLIVGTIIISQQLDYVRNQDLGANIEQTLVVEGGVAISPIRFIKGSII